MEFTLEIHPGGGYFNATAIMVEHNFCHRSQKRMHDFTHTGKRTCSQIELAAKLEGAPAIWVDGVGNGKRTWMALILLGPYLLWLNPRWYFHFAAAIESDLLLALQPGPAKLSREEVKMRSETWLNADLGSEWG